MKKLINVRELFYIRLNILGITLNVITKTCFTYISIYFWHKHQNFTCANLFSILYVVYLNNCGLNRLVAAVVESFIHVKSN